MFNVAICDDDKNFIQYVEDIIKELGYAEDVKFFEYLSGEEFLNHLRRILKFRLLDFY